MKTRNIFGTLTIAALITACGGTSTKESSTNEEAAATEEVAQVCTYAYNNTAEVMWVAYKYTEKVGVKGVFEEVSISNTGTGNSIADVLNGASININTASSNSGDPTRDPKIKETFFGALTNGQEISGEITSVSGDNEAGNVEANIVMNGQSQSVSGDYTIKNGILDIKFGLSVESWSATDALNALNEVCEDLHKGADGKSILWPDVTVFVTSALATDCK